MFTPATRLLIMVHIPLLVITESSSTSFAIVLIVNALQYSLFWAAIQALWCRNIGHIARSKRLNGKAKRMT